jgi:hypothetical protein
LDYAKLSLYRFWYKVMKPAFPDIKLIYTDTDSAICLVKSGDIYRDCQRMEREVFNGGQPLTKVGSGIFDWSSLDPTVHPTYYSMLNSKELGHFKFDDGSLIPGEFIALRSKMYSKFNVFDLRTMSYTKPKNTAKGVPRECATQLDYVNCIMTGEVSKVHFVRITGRHFELSTQPMMKEGLAPPFFNDKRFIRKQADTWEALALGHCMLRV